MAELGALKVDLSIDTANFTRSVADINRKLRGLHSEFIATASGNENFEKSLEGLRAKSKNLTKQFKLHEQKVQELRKRYEESAKTKGKDAKETENLLIRYNRAVTAMNKTKNQLDKVNEEIDNQTNKWKKLRTSLDKTSEKFKDVGSKIKSAGQSMTMSVTAPIVGLGAAIVKTGADFEEAMDKVAAISGATGEDLKALEKQAKELGASTKFSASEAASGMQFLAMAGFETNEILDAMPGLLDLAASSAMDLGEAADIASNIMSGFGIDASKAGHVSDVLAHVASNANTNVQEMGEAMKYAAPVAKSMGISLEETAAAVGLMADAGIKASQAGTTLRGSLTRLAKAPGEAGEAMRKIDWSPVDEGSGKMKSLAVIIEELNEKTKDMTSAERSELMAKLFGTEAVAGWLAMMDRGAEELNSFSVELVNADGAAKRMAETMAGNTKGSFKEMMSALEGLAIQLSDILLPYVNQGIEYITKLTRKFSEMSPETQKLAVTIGALAAVFPPILMVLGLMSSGLGATIKLFAPLIGVIGKAGGALKVLKIAFTAMTGPIGITIAAISALIAIGVTLYKNWDTVSAKAKQIWGSISDWFSKTLDSIKKFFVDTWSNITKKLEEIWNLIKDKANQIFESAKQGIVNIFTSARDKVLFVANSLKNGIQYTFGRARELISNIWNRISENVTTAVGIMIDIVTLDFSSLKNIIGDKMEGAKTKIKDIWSSVTDFFEGISLYQIGKDIIQGLIDGMGALADKVWEKVTDIAGSIKNAAKRILGIASPSKVMRDEVGRWIPEGLAEGISGNMGAIIKATDEMSKATIPESLAYDSNGQKVSKSSSGVNRSAQQSTINEGDKIYNFERMFEGAFKGATFNLSDQNQAQELLEQMQKMFQNLMIEQGVKG